MSSKHVREAIEYAHAICACVSLSDYPRSIVISFVMLTSLLYEYRRSMNVDARCRQMERVQKEGLELFRRKNHDYGDAFADCGVVGVIVRIGDKLARLRSVTKHSVTLVNDESLRDTLLDLHNYTAMAIALMDETE